MFVLQIIEYLCTIESVLTQCIPDTVTTLQIQQSVGNTNWILQAVFCQSVYCICCPTWPSQNNCWKWHWHMCHWKWYLNFGRSSWKQWWHYIHIHGRHWIPHHNKHSDNDCELDVIIHVVHQRRLSMNDDQTWLHVMKMSCMALRKYRMETRHWGACSVLYAVPRAGDSVLNLISACQSDDWEDICVALETSSSMYMRILSLNHPHLQLVTPLWPPTSLQPHTTLIPKLHTLQNHPHPSNCSHPSTTYLNHTYPPTTHIPSNHKHTLQPHIFLNHPHLMPVHRAQMNTLEQDDPDTWKAWIS